jgi:hypothetical protein
MVLLPVFGYPTSEPRYKAAAAQEDHHTELLTNEKLRVKADPLRLPLIGEITPDLIG